MDPTTKSFIDILVDLYVYHPMVLFAIVLLFIAAIIALSIRISIQEPPPPPPPKQGIGDFIAKEIIKGWERNVPQSIVTEDGVTVNYRFAGSLALYPQDEKAFIEQTDAEIRRIIRNDRHADLTKFEMTLKIKVLSVQVGAPPPPPPPPQPKGFYG